ncbi:hypothetical protein ACGC1H_007030 [Rhizoctonia solani]
MIMPESSKVESVQGTPVSIRAMSSEFSDIESVVSLSDHTSSGPNIVPENPKSAPVHPEFAFPDGNIDIQTTEHTFWVHEYHLNKFSVFAALIQAATGSETALEPGCRIVITCEQKVKGVDVYNALKVIYASHIDGIPDFDSSIMTSTLRIASAFDYPALRKFAISKLEGMKLPAIQRIELSDEFSLPAWETPAFTELCSRKEPISQAEAEVLGMMRFVEIARIRETERTCCEVKLVSEDLLQLIGNSPGGSVNTESMQDNLEYSSGHSNLPKCNCRATTSNRNSYNEYVDFLSTGPVTLIHCDIHKVAPQVLKEGQLLLKQRNELLGKLASVRSTVDQSLQHGESPSDLKVLDSIRKELSKASWIRKDCATTTQSQ